MKNILIAILLISSLMACGLETENRNLTMPDLSVLLLDSVTKISTNEIPPGNPIVFMYFRPDCEHCNEETKAIIQNIDSLKHVKFYFLSPIAFENVKKFSQSYKLSTFGNFTVGMDDSLKFRRHFKPSGMPYIAIYNKHKRLVAIFDGKTKIKSLIEMVKE